jgi:hypothetical protein
VSADLLKAASGRQKRARTRQKTRKNDQFTLVFTFLFMILSDIQRFFIRLQSDVLATSRSTPPFVGIQCNIFLLLVGI